MQLACRPRGCRRRPSRGRCCTARRSSSSPPRRSLHRPRCRRAGSCRSPACAASGCEVETMLRAKTGSARRRVGPPVEAESSWHDDSARARPRACGERAVSRRRGTRLRASCLIAGSETMTIISAAAISRPADSGRVTNVRPVAARQQQRAAQVLLHHRPEDEAEQQRRRLAAELVEDVADDAEDRRHVDVEGVVVQRVEADAAEQLIAGKRKR